MKCRIYFRAVGTIFYPEPGKSFACRGCISVSVGLRGTLTVNVQLPRVLERAVREQGSAGPAREDFAGVLQLRNDRQRADRRVPVGARLQKTTKKNVGQSGVWISRRVEK